MRRVYAGIDKKYWHNSILSIEDGLFAYSFSFNKYTDNVRKILKKQKPNYNAAPFIHSYPLHIYNISNELYVTYDTDVTFMKADIDNPYAHILPFLTIVRGKIPSIITHTFDFVTYLDLGREDLFL